MNKKLSNMALVLVLLAASMPLTFAVPNNEPATYQYLIGTGFLCGLDPTACPAISMASNGDTILITGDGTLSVHPKSVTGDGTFMHMDAARNVLGEGTWTAEQLLSFDTYGNAPTVFPPEFEGGRATIRVHLSPSAGGPGIDAVMQVDCLIGDFPTAAMEGIRLNVQNALNFNKEVSGFTLFIKE